MLYLTYMENRRDTDRWADECKETDIQKKCTKQTDKSQKTLLQVSKKTSLILSHHLKKARGGPWL